MSHFDALMYALGLLAFWLGLIALTVSLFVVASRADAAEKHNHRKDNEYLVSVRDNLESAIRDMLDFSTGWSGPLTEKERLERITAIGEAALDILYEGASMCACGQPEPCGEPCTYS